MDLSEYSVLFWLYFIWLLLLCFFEEVEEELFLWSRLLLKEECEVCCVGSGFPEWWLLLLLMWWLLCWGCNLFRVGKEVSWTFLELLLSRMLRFLCGFEKLLEINQRFNYTLNFDKFEPKLKSKSKWSFHFSRLAKIWLSVESVK